jgi:hypothetical protein
MLTGASQKRAAAAASVTPKTLRAWLQDPEFLEELSRARRVVLARSAAALAGSTTRAAKTLARSLGSPNPHVAVRAAVALLDAAARASSLEDLEARVRALEGAKNERLVGNGLGPQANGA